MTTSDPNAPDFAYWFDNIVSSSLLIASPDALTRAWIQRERITSWYGVDEMLEQLLGDLHLREDACRFEENLRRIEAFGAVQKFAEAVVVLEALVRDDPHFKKAETLLASAPWTVVRTAAEGVVKLTAAKEFKSWW